MLKLVLISDTHMRPLKDILKGFEDKEAILIHCGDALSAGTAKEWYKFSQELREIRDSFSRIIYVPGNHDIHVERCTNLCELELSSVGIDLLIDKSLMIKDNHGNEYHFYGSPWVPYIGMWAFEHPALWDVTAYEHTWSKIPQNTDVLITHTPPGNILAGPWGDPYLVSHILERVRPQIHCFGHVHSYGNCFQNINKTTFYNAAICNEAYIPSNKPIVTEVL